MGAKFSPTATAQPIPAKNASLALQAAAGKQRHSFGTLPEQV
jgi:hypothetical protein